MRNQRTPAVRNPSLMRQEMEVEAYSQSSFFTSVKLLRLMESTRS